MLLELVLLTTGCPLARQASNYGISNQCSLIQTKYTHGLMDVLSVLFHQHDEQQHNVFLSSATSLISLVYRCNVYQPKISFYELTVLCLLAFILCCYLLFQNESIHVNDLCSSASTHFAEVFWVDKLFNQTPLSEHLIL